jgi:hypothetical protein
LTSGFAFGPRSGYLGVFYRNLLTPCARCPMQGGAAHGARTLRFRGRVFGQGRAAWGMPYALCPTERSCKLQRGGRDLIRDDGRLSGKVATPMAARAVFRLRSRRGRGSLGSLIMIQPLTWSSSPGACASSRVASFVAMPKGPRAEAKRFFAAAASTGAPERYSALFESSRRDCTMPGVGSRDSSPEGGTSSDRVALIVASRAGRVPLTT